MADRLKNDYMGGAQASWGQALQRFADNKPELPGEKQAFAIAKSPDRLNDIARAGLGLAMTSFMNKFFPDNEKEEEEKPKVPVDKIKDFGFDKTEEKEDGKSIQ